MLPTLRWSLIELSLAICFDAYCKSTQKFIIIQYWNFDFYAWKATARYSRLLHTISNSIDTHALFLTCSKISRWRLYFIYHCPISKITTLIYGTRRHTGPAAISSLISFHSAVMIFALLSSQAPDFDCFSWSIFGPMIWLITSGAADTHIYIYFTISYSRAALPQRAKHIS